MAVRPSLFRLPLAIAPAKSKETIAKCASPLAYWPVYTAPTPKGKKPARIPATVGFGPLPLPVGGGGGRTCPGAAGEALCGKPPGTNPEAAEAPVGTPSIFAPRQSSQ